MAELPIAVAGDGRGERADLSADDDGLARWTARSVILSALLGTTPPRLPASRLVRFGDLFDIAPGTIRTALSRMAAAGDLSLDDGWYSLGARHVERDARQRRGRRPPAAWDGGWRALVAVRTAPTVTRNRRRAELERAGWAAWREGVWLSALDVAVPTGAEDLVEARMDIELDPRSLAEGLWGLSAWARRADALVDVAEVTERTLRRAIADPVAASTGTDLREGFVAAAGVVRHLGATPPVPEELWPDGQFDHGTRLRTAYDGLEDAVQDGLADWLSSASRS